MIRLSFMQIAAGIVIVAGLGFLVGAQFGMWLERRSWNRVRGRFAGTLAATGFASGRKFAAGQVVCFATSWLYSRSR
jgi:hypothetical protein